MSKSSHALVHVGIRGHVVAIDRATGAEVWRTPLKGSSFVNVAIDGDLLLAGTRGQLFAVDPSTGRILWSNPLPGLGFGVIGLPTTNPAAAVEQMSRDDDAAASAAASAS